MENDSIKTLLRKIHALAKDPAAPPGEREAAARKLAAIMARHGLTESDLTDSTLGQYTFLPAPQNKAENELAKQLFAMVTSSIKIRYWRCGKYGICVECTKTQTADLADAWAHYLPLFRQHFIATEKQVKKDLAAAKARAAQDRAVAGLAFYHRFDIGAPSDDDDTPPELTPEQRAAALAAFRLARGIKGDKWQRKAGHLDESTPAAFQLSNG